MTEHYPVLPEKFRDTFPENNGFTKSWRVGNDIFYAAENSGEVAVKHRESPKTASRSWVNNNPGNIEDGDFARRHGAIGTDGRFAVFPNARAGFDAQESLLRGATYSHMTLEEVIKKYAPKKENDVTIYVNFVSKKSGIPADTPIAALDSPSLRKVMYAMAEHEGWKPGDTYPAQSQPANKTEMTDRDPSTKDIVREIFGPSSLDTAGNFSKLFNDAAPPVKQEEGRAKHIVPSERFVIALDFP